jgi:hypothetical protein
VTGALLGEGTSDRALLPILRWLVAQISSADIRLEWVDSSRFAWPRRTLAEKVRLALLACPCDLLFVHRDADNQHPALRHAEIANAVGTQRFVAVVPIRETEAWLLIDESAIAHATHRRCQRSQATPPRHLASRPRGRGAEGSPIRPRHGRSPGGGSGGGLVAAPGVVRFPASRDGYAGRAARTGAPER